MRKTFFADLGSCTCSLVSEGPVFQTEQLGCFNLPALVDFIGEHLSCSTELSVVFGYDHPQVYVETSPSDRQAEQKEPFALK